MIINSLLDTEYKICTKCNKEKELSEFYKRNKHKDGLSYQCKTCLIAFTRKWIDNNKSKYLNGRKNYKELKPWIVTLYAITSRCNDPNNTVYKYYGGKGIKCNITEEELKFLWYRDKAYYLKQPSINRKNHNKNYILSNCEYIEKTNNISERNTRICSKKVLQYDLNGNFIKEWKSIIEVEKILGIFNQNIGKCCLGKYKTAGSFIWKYKEIK